MVNVDPKIFKAYDIRGTYPDQVNPETFYLFGRAYLEFLDGDKVVVGRDARPSSFDLFKALAAGIEEQGGQVINIAEATTPLLYFAVNYLQADGGLMITASHNPAGYNGLKATKEKAIPMHGEILTEIGGKMQNKNVSNLQEKTSQIQPDTRELKQNYLRHILGKAGEEINFSQKIAVDCGNGMAGLLVKPLFNELGIDYEILYQEPDCTFPNHEANPLKEETLTDLRELMKQEDIELGVAFDGDADRVSFVTQSEIISGDFITALLAEQQLQKQKGPVVYDLRSSKVVPEIIEDNGGEPVKSRVGHSFIKQTMREKQAVFAGELSSHYYYPFDIKDERAYFESPLLAVLQLLKKSESENLKELVDSLKKYSQSGEINFEVEDKQQVMNKLEQHYKAEANKISHLDGVSVEFDEWWFNVRPSNTEPVLRLNLEAETEQLMEDKTEEVKSLIQL